MKKQIRYTALFCLLSIVTCLSGCSQTVETTASLDDSKIPWGRPADWEKTMPIAPGFRY